MKKIELSKQGKNKGKYVALVDDDDFEELNKYNWSIVPKNGGVYAGRIDVDRKKVAMHRQIMNPPKHKVVDHKNHNTLDNQKLNLRIASRTQNQCNRIRRKLYSSQFKGVTWSERRKEWIVQVHWEGKRIYNGYFKDEIEAAKAYDNKAKELFGEFATLNQI